jgi:hypothetical protein
LRLPIGVLLAILAVARRRCGPRGGPIVLDIRI